MLDYFTHKFNPNNITLVMTILVKNEADIIEANIKTHAKLGIDAFVVMDNNSTDGTREILSKLKNQFNITIIDEKGYYQQKKFMTKLAFIAKKLYKPDWIINNDADEFWIPNNNKSLKECLKFKGSIIFIKRSNMIIDEKSNSWKDFKYHVSNQINYNNGESNIILGKIGRKVIVNPHGLIKINSGNHSAEHIAFWKKLEIDTIHIYHYPIRNFTQFELNIKNRKKLLDKYNNIKMGTHYKKWIDIYKKNNLMNEYKKFVFNKNEINILKKFGILSENNNRFILSI